MLELTGTLLWGWVLALGFVGWGRLCRRALGFEGDARSGELAAVGMACTLLSGMLMNLLELISRPLLLGWVALGALTEVWTWRARWRERRASTNDTPHERRWANLGIAVLVSVPALVFYAGTLAAYGFDAFGGGFNGHDDAHAYLMFPQQMLERGAMTEDPFNERRMIASLGGQSFLHALVLTVLPEESLKSLDPGLAFLGCVALMYGAVRSTTVSRWALVPVVGVLFVLRYPMVNISSLGTSLYALLALPWVLYRWRQAARPVANGCLLGLLAAGAILLKSLNVPTVGVFCAYYGLALLWMTGWRRQMVVELGVGLGVLVVALLPAMLSMLRSSGTLLYPLLGKGHGGGGSQLAALELGWGTLLFEWVSGRDILVLLALGLFAAFTLPVRSREWAVATGVALAALLTSVALARVFQGHHPRYHFAAVSAAIVICATFVVRAGHWRVGGVSALLFGLLPFHAPDLAYRFLPHWEQLPNAWTGRSQLAAQRHAVRKLQRRVPEGAPLLARLDAPYALDFSRNPILAVDLPCGVGAPPGMPCDRGLNTLVSYLRDNGIQHVAFAYRGEANYSRRQFSHYLTSKDPLMRIQAERAFRFHELLTRVGQCYPRHFDDGLRWLVELDERDCTRPSPRRRASRRARQRRTLGKASPRQR